MTHTGRGVVSIHEIHQGEGRGSRFTFEDVNSEAKTSCVVINGIFQDSGLILIRDTIDAYLKDKS